MKGKTPPGIAVAIGSTVVLASAFVFANCGGCKKAGTAPGPPGVPVAVAAADGGAPQVVVPHDPLLWGNAKDGDPEDLMTLAVHEGAAGLVDAASDPELRPTAIRAMAYAGGYAQLPFLARTMTSGSAEDAKAAIDSTVELAARPRTSEDVEDVEELELGCTTLATFARDAKGDRARRVAAVRALRMLPCPKLDVPIELDAH